MNCIFTIVAKNYLALALTLGDSIRTVLPEYDFIIFLADGVDGEIDLSRQKYKIMEVKDVGIDQWLDMAFKYDISEFSTSIKPFCFDYLARESKYDNIMYFDPDIYLYDKLTRIEVLLQENICVVTPHHLDMEVVWSGAVPENNILISGIYNLGFIAFRNCRESRFIFEWWKERLRNKCYIERTEGLFYDQNWIQFLSSAFEKGIFVLRDYGYNIAWWNLHERSIEFQNDIPMVIHKNDEVKYRCVFFHFSGFNVLDPKVLNSRYRRNPFFQLEYQPALQRLFREYAQRVIGNGHKALCQLKYKFNRFDNGHVIAKLHRRLYRELTSRDRGYRNMDAVRRSLISRVQEMNLQFENPFSIQEGSYYGLLKRNGLIIKESSLPLDHLNPDRDSGGVHKKILLAIKLLSLFKKLIGIKNYLTIMKFINLYSKDEYQLFLIRDLESRD